MNTEQLLPALRLIGWCKNVSGSCVQNFSDSIFRPPVMRALADAGLLRPYTEAYGWRLTAAGYRVLAESGFPIAADRHTQRPKRRFENAAVIVTMYAAGINPFCGTLSELRTTDAFLPASALRAARGQHVLGSNQVGGFLRLNQRLFAAHHPAEGRMIVPHRERDCLSAAALGTNSEDGGYLFYGDSFSAIYRALTERTQAVPAGSRRKRCEYVDFFETIQTAYLLPCTAIGARQLRLLRITDYRARLRKLFGGGQIRTQDMPDCDFMDARRHTPVHITADLEIKSVYRAASQAKQAGYGGLLVAGFAEQLGFLKRILPPPFYSFAEIPACALDALKGGG